MAGELSALTIAEEICGGGMEMVDSTSPGVLRDDSVPFKDRVVGAISSKVVLRRRSALLG